jgi:hypothetical protein
MEIHIIYNVFNLRKYLSVQNQDNKTNIDNYIEKNPDDSILTQKSRTVTLNGKPVILQGYRLPLKLIYYNIENGRFASEYNRLVRDNGGKDLDATNKDNAKKIQNLLLELNSEDTKRTYDNVKQHGQTDLGIITQDGYLIDGNRRMSIISKLLEDTREPQYRFIEVAKLDRDISSKDLWAIEAGISMGMDPKVRYGPINELLKLEKGIKSGFSVDEIADLLYGGKPDEIDKKLKKLELMKEYLNEYYQDDENFTPLIGTDTHFTTIQDNEQAAEKKDIPIEELQAIRNIGFRLTRLQTPHRRMRSIGTAINKGMPLEKLVDASDNMGALDESKIKDDDYTSPTEIRFMDFEDEVRAQNSSDNVVILLNSVLTNLRVLNFKDQRLKTDESKQKISKIKKYVENLISDTEN